MKHVILGATGFILGLTMAGGANDVRLKLDIQVSKAELSPGLKTVVWSYNGSVPGMTIAAKPGTI